jgi:hypothetical protein
MTVTFIRNVLVNGIAWVAARVAHHPPVVARGPLALALRLVHGVLLVISIIITLSAEEQTT